MKITWKADGRIQSGMVVNKIGQVFVTRKGEHVHENDVLGQDNRGGPRENSGRKEKKKEEKLVQVWAQVPLDLKEWLETTADDLGMSMSTLIGQKLQEWKNG